MVKKLVRNLIQLLVFFGIFLFFFSIVQSKIDIPLELDITYNAIENDIIQVFYTDGESIKEFNELQSQNKPIQGNGVFNTLKFNLPISKIDKLRIDIGTKPGQIVIKEIKLKRFINIYKWVPKDILTNYKNQNDISNIYEKNGLLYIESLGADPYLSAEGMNGVSNLINDDGMLNIIKYAASLLCTFIIFALNKVWMRLTNNKAEAGNSLRTYFHNFYKYKGLLWELVVRDIKIKYKKSVLGLLWSLLNPLLMMIVTYVVFSNLFRFDIQNFPIYLLTGQIFFNFFSESTSVAMGSIMANSSLIRKVYIPKYIFPTSKVLSSLVNLLFSLIAIVLMIVITKVEITWAILLFPLSLLYLFMFALGVGLLLSAYAVFFRDLTHLYGIMLMVWTYLTPIFYPITIIPEKYRILIKINPMYYFIEHFRQVILYAKVPSLSINLICLAISVITLMFGLFTFYKNQNKFILYM